MQNEVKDSIPIKCLLYIYPVTFKRIPRTSVYPTRETFDIYNLSVCCDHRSRPPFNLHQLNHHSHRNIWMEHPSKRAKILSDSDDGSASTALTSLQRTISPPLPRGCPELTDGKLTSDTGDTGGTARPPKLVNSPVQLTHIRDLPDGNNVDTIRLRDILGDPMIRECWQFNYLFDVDFLMSQLDEDVRSLVQVKVVHG